ncbi:hypothetical protein D3C77_566810 [compost metagenome]
MGTMHRVARLEPDYGTPALLGEQAPRLGRIEIELAEPFRLRTIEHLYRSAHVIRRTLKELSYSRMLLILCFEYISRFLGLVHFIDALHVKQAVDDAVLFPYKSNTLGDFQLAGLLLAH